MKKNQQFFFDLLQAGLWERLPECFSRFLINDSVDWDQIFQLAEEQSVVGLVATGGNLVNCEGVKVNGTPLVPKNVSLKLIGRTMQLEHRNVEMNQFIGKLVVKMRRAGIETLLVKGQGVAQCYEKPLLRSSGDVDLLLSKENYLKAKEFLLPLSSYYKKEQYYSQHFGIDIDSWYIELHGTLRTGLSGRVDLEVDSVLDDVFRNERVRTWMNGNVQVLLPEPDHDVFLVFTHFIKHFYKEGLVLRQICDWVRLLWSYHEEIDATRLEAWINSAGLMDEWQTFASLSVDYLGMPVEAMPFYDIRFSVRGSRLHKKVERLVDFILKKGGAHKVRDTFEIARIFPWNTIKFIPSIFWNVNWLKVKERIIMDKH